MSAGLTNYLPIEEVASPGCEGNQPDDAEAERDNDEDAENSGADEYQPGTHAFTHE